MNKEQALTQLKKVYQAIVQVSDFNQRIEELEQAQKKRSTQIERKITAVPVVVSSLLLWYIIGIGLMLNFFLGVPFSFGQEFDVLRRIFTFQFIPNHDLQGNLVLFFGWLLLLLFVLFISWLLATLLWQLVLQQKITSAQKTDGTLQALTLELERLTKEKNRYFVSRDYKEILTYLPAKYRELQWLDKIYTVLNKTEVTDLSAAAELAQTMPEKATTHSFSQFVLEESLE